MTVRNAGGGQAATATGQTASLRKRQRDTENHEE